MLLPSHAANVLQSCNMTSAFSKQGVLTTFYPGIRDQKNKDIDAFLAAYGLRANDSLRAVPLNGRNKGLYGASFRARLAYEWLFAPSGTVFFARDVKEWMTLSRFKKYLPKKRTVIFELHEILAEDHARKNSGKEDFYRQIELRVFQHADGIVTTTERLKERLIQAYAPAAPIHVAPNGYNADVFSPLPDVDLSGDITIAYVGSFHKGKGVENLIASLEFLPEKFRLRIMGASPKAEFQELKKIAARFGNRVEFLGHVQPPDLMPRLAECQIFAIPQSSDEFFSPIKLSEALGTALPIVTTPLAPFKEFTADKVDIFMARDTTAKALAEAFAELAQDSELAHSLQNEARRTAQKMTWESRAKGCIEFINSLL